MNILLIDLAEQGWINILAPPSRRMCAANIFFSESIKANFDGEKI